MQRTKDAVLNISKKDLFKQMNSVLYKGTDDLFQNGLHLFVVLFVFNKTIPFCAFSYIILFVLVHLDQDMSSLLHIYLIFLNTSPTYNVYW